MFTDAYIVHQPPYSCCASRVKTLGLHPGIEFATVLAGTATVSRRVLRTGARPRCGDGLGHAARPACADLIAGPPATPAPALVGDGAPAAGRERGLDPAQQD